mmetsp:Transcript_40799/g.85510  ORF Transcript_40799/g.85510 Transcript_40799/m.85510 type:complete len:226 (-) Transcript_40799:3362-4039(-)
MTDECAILSMPSSSAGGVTSSLGVTFLSFALASITPANVAVAICTAAICSTRWTSLRRLLLLGLFTTFIMVVWPLFLWTFLGWVFRFVLIAFFLGALLSFTPPFLGALLTLSFGVFPQECLSCFMRLDFGGFLVFLRFDSFDEDFLWTFILCFGSFVDVCLAALALALVMASVDTSLVVLTWLAFLEKKGDLITEKSLCSSHSKSISRFERSQDGAESLFLAWLF